MLSRSRKYEGLPRVKLGLRRPMRSKAEGTDLWDSSDKRQDQRPRFCNYLDQYLDKGLRYSAMMTSELSSKPF